jgi:hypothetical protein
MILGCMDWIVLVIFGAFSISVVLQYIVTEPLLYGAREEICGAFKTIISLQFQEKPYIFFLSFSGVVQKVIFHVESNKYMYIMYKNCKIKHVS